MQNRASKEARNNSRTMNRAKAKSCENISSNAVTGAERSQARQNRLLGGKGSETGIDAKPSEITRLLALTPSQCYNTLANQRASANRYGSTANILQAPLTAQPNPGATPQPTALSGTTHSQRTIPNDDASQKIEQIEKVECSSNKFYHATAPHQASPLPVLSQSAHGLASNQAIYSQERSTTGLSQHSRNYRLNTNGSLPGCNNVATENSFISITKLPVDFRVSGCALEEQSQTQGVTDILPVPNFCESRMRSIAAPQTCKLKRTSKCTGARSEKSKHSQSKQSNKLFYSSVVQLELFEPAPARDTSALKAKSFVSRHK